MRIESSNEMPKLVCEDSKIVPLFASASPNISSSLLPLASPAFRYPRLNTLSIIGGQRPSCEARSLRREDSEG
jgi:hypothetical protein